VATTTLLALWSGTSRTPQDRAKLLNSSIVAHSEVRHPPQRGWLDEWGRLKGGHPLVLSVAPRRALVLHSKLSAASIRFFLFADVGADWL